MKHKEFKIETIVAKDTLNIDLMKQVMGGKVLTTKSEDICSPLCFQFCSLDCNQLICQLCGQHCSTKGSL